MTTTTAWGKPGVRLTPQEVAQRAADRRAAANRAATAEKAAEEAAYAAWRAGKVRPWRITLALDVRGLYGPEVDEACGVAEPAVDEWEAGRLYPSWEQLRALAALTDFAPTFFVRDEPPKIDGPVFICSRSHPVTGTAVVTKTLDDYVLEFDREAVALTVSMHDGVPINAPVTDPHEQADRLVSVVARLTGDTPDVVRLKHGIATPEEGTLF